MSLSLQNDRIIAAQRLTITAIGEALAPNACEPPRQERA
jgi:hypothetical protein